MMAWISHLISLFLLLNELSLNVYLVQPMEQDGSCKLSEELISFCYSKNKNQDPDRYLEALTILERSRDLPSFIWCLTNLHNFQNEKVREFAIGNIRNFLFGSWIQIPETIYPLLIETFTTIFQDPNYQEQKFKFKIWESLTLIAHGLYPSSWPGFFDYILQLPKPDFYGILNQLNYSMLPNASVFRRDILGFRNSSLLDGSQMAILNAVVIDALNGIHGAGNALASTIEWIDLSLLLNPQLISTFVQMLSQESTVKSGLTIFISIFSRHISLDVLYELVTQLQLTNIIAQLASSFSIDSEIILSCSKLLFQAFESLCTSISVTMTPLIEAVADVAINLYLLPFDKSPLFNSRLLHLIFRSHPDLAVKYFDNLIMKISQSIAIKSVDSDLITTTSLNLLVNAAKYAEIDVIPHFLNLTQGLTLPQNIVEIATLISAFNSFLTNFEDPDNHLLLMLIPMFAPLLGIEPPYEQPHYVAMDQYLSLLMPVFNELPPDFQAQAIMKLVEIIMTPTEDAIPEKKTISENFTSLARSMPELIVTTPGIKPMLPAFVQTGNLLLIQAASFLVSALDISERSEFYSSIIPAFASLLNESKHVDSTRIREILKRIFSFWVYSKTNDLPDIQSVLFEFFQSIYLPNKDLFKSESLFSEFCQGSVNTLGPAAFPLFWGTTELIKEYNNASAIVKAGLALAANPPYDDGIAILFNFIISVVQSSQRLSKMRHQSDEHHDKQLFLEYVAQFFILIIPNIADETIKNVAIATLVDLINREKLPFKLIDDIILLFMTNPQYFVFLVIDGVFHAFMGILYEFYANVDENAEQKKLIVDILRLVKVMFPFVPDFSFQSHIWEHLKPISEDGIEILLKIIKSQDDTIFDRNVKDLLNYLHPPPSINDGNIADVEDDFDQSEND